MDPDACLSELFEQLAESHWQEAAEQAESLLEWMAQGGFLPGGGRLRPLSLAAFLNWVIKQQLEGDAS
jgi:hypothetical protein